MALVLLLPAHGAMACQLVCMLTNQLYNGDLGGLAGADTKCDAEFKGFKFARSRSILANLAGGSPVTANRLYTYNAGLGKWVGRDPDETNPVGGSDEPTGVAVAPYPGVGGMAGAWVHGPGVVSCTNWTDNTFGQPGSITSPPLQANCANPRPLLCCNLNM